MGVAGAVEAAQVTDKVEAEELAANLTRAKNVKARMVAAMGEANDLVTSVATQSEWKWADTEQTVGKLNCIMKEIGELKTSSKMWKDWVTTDHKQWVVMMKKQFLPSDCQRACQDRGLRKDRQHVVCTNYQDEEHASPHECRPRNLVGQP